MKTRYSMVVIDQRPKRFTRAWLFAWAIKYIQWLCCRDWGKARFNHVGVKEVRAKPYTDPSGAEYDLIESFIHELDGGYFDTNAVFYPYEFQDSSLVTNLVYMFDDRLNQLSSFEYNIWYNLSTLPKIGKWFHWIKPGNCVWWACVLLNITAYRRDMPWKLVR